MTDHAAPLRPFAIVCAGLVALAVAMGIGRFAFTPILPMMLAERSVDLAGASLLASANYLGYLVGALACTFQPLAVAPHRPHRRRRRTFSGAARAGGDRAADAGHGPHAPLAWPGCASPRAWRAPWCSSTRRAGASSSWRAGRCRPWVR
ncbi:YbfB/YjiJ family MFS transporter [Ramlibacter terrae]|uniref:YbfB/YjiJ family MFS transporter n=1 Tax=Ramlibacter terrae TaxID=2732511 RepID=A0ABX6P2K1_9BURK|nr:YbfB/YjiJ family MFS transporter [Ramlibacter terrae]